MLFVFYYSFVHPTAVAVLVMTIRNSIKMFNFFHPWQAIPEKVAVVTELPGTYIPRNEFLPTRFIHIQKALLTVDVSSGCV